MLFVILFVKKLYTESKYIYIYFLIIFYFIFQKKEKEIGAWNKLQVDAKSGKKSSYDR